MIPTPEQLAIVEAVRSSRTSLMISAYAGCAKTTSLCLLAEAVPRTIPALALAFNVKIKKELEGRLPANFTVLTMNGLGHRAWTKTMGHRALSIDDAKLPTIIKAELRGVQYSSDAFGNIRALVSRAQHQGLVPTKFISASSGARVPDTEESWTGFAEYLGIDLDPSLLAQARSVLAISIDQAFRGRLSFDDQIYMPTMYRGQFPKFPLVLVDEAQDLSVLNHIQIQRSATDRIIAVGDPKQAIYAFRGATHGSMDALRSIREEWIDLTLSTTFRCPKKIVERQQRHAPGFTAAAGASEGKVTLIPKDQPWHLPPGPVTVLCRNNAPLLSLGFRLIRQNVGVIMLGRDLGRGLISLSRKILPDDGTPRDECIRRIRDYENREAGIAEANNRLDKADAIVDRTQSLLAVLEDETCASAGVLRLRLTSLFSATACRVVLSTGHRAKGLEWPTVIHLDPFRIPARFARSEAALLQENNLRYVIETRAKNHLIEANLDDFQGPLP